MRAALQFVLTICLGSSAAIAAEPLRVHESVPEIPRGNNWQQSLDELTRLGTPASWTLLGPIHDSNLKLFLKDDSLEAETREDWTRVPRAPSERSFHVTQWTRGDDEKGCYVDLSELLDDAYVKEAAIVRGVDPEKMTKEEERMIRTRPRGDLLAYAQTSIDWPVDGPALLWFETAGRAVVLLNGRRVEALAPARFRREKERSLDISTQTMYPVHVELKKGLNVLKLKLGRDSNANLKDWGFYVRLERRDAAYRKGLFEKLSANYPEESAGWRGAEALLELAHTQERTGQTTLAEDAYARVIEALGDQAWAADYIAEAAASRESVRQRRTEDPAVSKKAWERAEFAFRASLRSADQPGADRVLREYIARYPLSEGAGFALCYRGTLRQDYSFSQQCRPFFERAAREFSQNETVRRMALKGLQYSRVQRPQQPLPETRPETQTALEAAHRQLVSGRAKDIERAMRSIGTAQNQDGDVLVRISDSQFYPRYVGSRQYTSALIRAAGLDAKDAYCKIVEHTAEEHLALALAMRDSNALENVAAEFSGTPSAARALVQLGNVYLDRGLFSRATVAFKTALRDYPGSVSINENMVRAKLLRAEFADGKTDAGQTLAREMGAGVVPIVIAGKTTSLAEFARAETARATAQSRSAAVLSVAPEPAKNSAKKPGAIAWQHKTTRSPSSDYVRRLWPEDLHFSHIQSFPVINQERVFLSTLDGVQAHDLKSGQMIWQQKWESGGALIANKECGRPLSIPALWNGRIFMRALQTINGEYGDFTSLRCHDSGSGAPLWNSRKDPALKKAIWLSDPVVAHGLAIAVFMENVESNGAAPPGSGLNIHGIAALDALTGELRWKRMLLRGTTEVQVYEPNAQPKGWGRYRPSVQLCPPAESGGVVYAHTGLGSVAAMNAFSGDVIWVSSYPRFRCENNQMGNSGIDKFMLRLLKLLARGAVSPVVGEDVVAIAPKDASGLIGFDKRSGEIRWQHEMIDCRFLAGASGGNVLAVDKTTKAISLSTGKVVWEFALRPENQVYGQPGLNGDMLYVPTTDNLQLFDARNGMFVSSRDWENESGALANFAFGPGVMVGINPRLFAAMELK